jgi:hypothetical protein
MPVNALEYAAPEAARAVDAIDSAGGTASSARPT